MGNRFECSKYNEDEVFLLWLMLILNVSMVGELLVCRYFYSFNNNVLNLLVAISLVSAIVYTHKRRRWMNVIRLICSILLLVSTFIFSFESVLFLQTALGITCFFHLMLPLQFVYIDYVHKHTSI